MSFRESFRSIKQFLRPEGTVQQRAVLSAVWESFLNISDRLLQLVKLFVLARLLAPSDFGLFGIALLTAASIQWFTKIGVRAALIQKSAENVDEYLDTAFMMYLFRGVLIGTVVALAAPYIASFFSEPRATDLIRVVAIAPILSGLQNPGIVYFQKDIEFQKKFLLNSVGVLGNVVVAITVALLYQSVWALVLGYLSGRVIGVVSSYLLHPYRPSLNFDIEQAKELFGYGKWITASGMVLFLTGQGDDAFVGWFLGATALGFYRVAYRIGNAPGGELAEIVSNVIFPAYSKIQDSPSRLRSGFFKSVKFSTALAFPASVGIVVVAEPFVRIFLTPEWLPIVPALGWLAIYSMFLTVSKINNSMMKAVGRPDVATKFQFVKFLVIALLIFPATDRFGFTGTAAVITLSALIAEGPKILVTLSELETSLKRYSRTVVPPLVASILMGIGVYTFQQLITPTSVLIQFVVSVALGVITYVILMGVVEWKLDYGLLELATGIINQFGGDEESSS